MISLKIRSLLFVSAIALSACGGGDSAEGNSGGKLGKFSFTSSPYGLSSVDVCSVSDVGTIEEEGATLFLDQCAETTKSNQEVTTYFRGANASDEDYRVQYCVYVDRDTSRQSGTCYSGDAYYKDGTIVYDFKNRVMTINNLKLTYSSFEGPRSAPPKETVISGSVKF